MSTFPPDRAVFLRQKVAGDIISVSTSEQGHLTALLVAAAIRASGNVDVDALVNGSNTTRPNCFDAVTQDQRYHCRSLMLSPEKTWNDKPVGEEVPYAHRASFYAGNAYGERVTV